MVVTESLEPLNELIIAMGKYLGDKYTVHHMSGEDKLNKYHNIAVIDNDLQIAAFLKAPRSFLVEPEDGFCSQARVVDILTAEALKTISIEVEKLA